MTTLREPWFWTDEGLVARFARAALQPAAFAYSVANRARRLSTRAFIAPTPIVCVGAATIGGAGKTPFSLKLAQLLSPDAGEVFFLTRGYGGRNQGPLRAPADAAAAEIGDEATLLAAERPTIVASDRRAGARLAANEGADLIIMDDGHQNPTLSKDVSVLLVSGGEAGDRGRLFPAGRYRERLADAAARADAVIYVGGEAPEGFEPPPGAIVSSARLIPHTNRLEGRFLAFCGIARPARFFRMLEALGAELVGEISFPDHHPFTEREIAILRARASAERAILITTEKDAARLDPDLKEAIHIFKVEMAIDEGERLAGAILERIRARRPDWRPS